MELMTVDTRAEVASGLIACIQGLDVRSVDLRLSILDLRNILAESNATEVECRMVCSPLGDWPWVSIDFRDDSDIKWHLVTDISRATYEDFRDANDGARWYESGGVTRAADLTAAEMRLTIEKEITRNGS